MLGAKAASEFARYKYSLYEYLYYFIREARQIPGEVNLLTARENAGLPGN
jgi:hypothetical protein